MVWIRTRHFGQHNDAFATLGHARWIINEMGKIVAVNLALNCDE
jgi:hypothetical protein